MTDCWKIDPDDRPTFTELRARTCDLLWKLSKVSNFLKHYVCTTYSIVPGASESSSFSFVSILAEFQKQLSRNFLFIFTYFLSSCHISCRLNSKSRLMATFSRSGPSYQVEETIFSIFQYDVGV